MYILQEDNILRYAVRFFTDEQLEDDTTMNTMIHRTLRFWILPAMLVITLGCDDTYVQDSPNAPTNLRSAAVGDGHTELIWDDNSTVEDGFIIEKRDDQTAEFTEIARVQEATYTDTSPMLMEKDYQYRVAAYLGDQMSGYSNVVSLSHNMEVPRTFRVDGSVTDQVKLTWETDNNPHPNTQVKIERSPTGLGEWSFLATTAHSGSYVDASATIPGPWYYRIAQVSPNNQTAFSLPIGARYGLAKTETKTANEISNTYGCALSYQSFVLPDQDLLIQFSKYRVQQSYSFYISRLSDGSRLVNSSIDDSGINVTFTPDQQYFLADSDYPLAAGKELQLRRTANGDIVKTVPVGQMQQAGLISDSKAIATIFSSMVNGNNHYDVVEVDLNSGQISVLQEDVWAVNLATTSKVGHYLIAEGNGTARVYNSNHTQVSSWNIGTPNVLTYSPDGSELLVGHVESIETFNTATYNRKIEAELPHLYKYASFSPDNKIYTTYCHPALTHQPTTWVQRIDRSSGKVEEYSVTSTPAMVYSLSAGKMNVIYTDSIRTLSFGWMPGSTIIID